MYNSTLVYLRNKYNFLKSTTAMKILKNVNASHKNFYDVGKNMKTEKNIIQQSTQLNNIKQY